MVELTDKMCLCEAERFLVTKREVRPWWRLKRNNDGSAFNEWSRTLKQIDSEFTPALSL